MLTELCDAIFAYYMLMLGAGAVSGVRSSLRSATPASATPDADGGAPGSAAPDPDRSPGSAAASARMPLGDRLHAAGKRSARAAARAARHPRTAAFVGWASGARLYRVSHRRTRIIATRVIARRTVAPETPTAPVAPDPVVPGTVDPATQGGPTGTAAPEPAPSGDQQPAATGPGQPSGEPGATASGDDPLDAWRDILPDSTPAATADAVEPGPRPRLFLVPPPKEYPSMSEIYDYESAQSFTGEASATAAMEAEDSQSAAESTSAAAEFAGQTAARVDVEIQTIEAGIATMSVLGVDPNSLAAYHQFLEAGVVYRDLAATFAAGLAELTGVAASMSAAAANYHEFGAGALDTITAEQGLHDEAAKATGHGGADGSFFGVESTSGTALPGPAPALSAPAPALPVGS